MGSPDSPISLKENLRLLRAMCDCEYVSIPHAWFSQLFDALPSCHTVHITTTSGDGVVMSGETARWILDNIEEAE